MGVMLSLDRHRPDKGRRQGQHVRHPGDQARTQAAVRRYDAPARGRLLARVARKVMVRRRRPEAGQGQPPEPNWPSGPNPHPGLPAVGQPRWWGNPPAGTGRRPDRHRSVGPDAGAPAA